MGTDAIVAQPATLTGSIGVVFGKFTTGGALREARRRHRAGEGQGRFGRDLLAADPILGRRAGEGAGARGRHLRAVRRQGGRGGGRPRGTPSTRVAQGRVWTGRQALGARGWWTSLGGPEPGHRPSPRSMPASTRTKRSGWSRVPRARRASSSCSTKGSRWPASSGRWRGCRLPRRRWWAGRPRRYDSSVPANRWPSMPRCAPALSVAGRLSVVAAPLRGRLGLKAPMSMSIGMRTFAFSMYAVKNWFCRSTIISLRNRSRLAWKSVRSASWRSWT